MFQEVHALTVTHTHSHTYFLFCTRMYMLTQGQLHKLYTSVEYAHMHEQTTTHAHAHATHTKSHRHTHEQAPPSPTIDNTQVMHRVAIHHNILPSGSYYRFCYLSRLTTTLYVRGRATI